MEERRSSMYSSSEEKADISPGKELSKQGLNGPPVFIKITENKPCGFDRAKRAKSGLFHCVYDCDMYFGTLEESRNHKNCPNRQKCEKDLEQMQATLAPDGFQYVPQKDWTPKECNEFEKFLKKLPKQDKRAFVQEYVWRHQQDPNQDANK